MIIKMFKGIFRFFVSSAATIFRLIFIGGIVTAILLTVVDSFTNSKFGTNNLVIITASLAFFPLFIALFVEFTIRGYRKEKRKKQQTKTKLVNQKG